MSARPMDQGVLRTIIEAQLLSVKEPLSEEAIICDFEDLREIELMQCLSSTCDVWQHGKDLFSRTAPPHKP